MLDNSENQIKSDLKSGQHENRSCEIEFAIRHVTFHNEENKLTVLKGAIYQSEDKEDYVTVTGAFHLSIHGLVLKTKGEWVNLPRSGNVFKVEQYIVRYPEQMMDIVRFLSSEYFSKGLGPLMAQRIVEQFGNKTFEIIEKEPNRLIEAPGVGQKRIQMLILSWKGFQHLMSAPPIPQPDYEIEERRTNSGASERTVVPPKNSYQERLSSPKWQKKRLEVLQNANWRCQLCGNDREELHVHHSYYERGRAPWDYPNSSLIALCKRCHEKT
jgi:hypothetical protein